MTDLGAPWWCAQTSEHGSVHCFRDLHRLGLKRLEGRDPHGLLPRPGDDRAGLGRALALRYGNQPFHAHLGERMVR